MPLYVKGQAAEDSVPIFMARKPGTVSAFCNTTVLSRFDREASETKGQYSHRYLERQQWIQEDEEEKQEEEEEEEEEKQEEEELEEVEQKEEDSQEEEEQEDSDSEGKEDIYINCNYIQLNDIFCYLFLDQNI